MKNLTNEQITKMCEYYASAKTYVSYKTVANAFYSLGVTEQNIPKIFKNAIINGIISLDMAKKMKERSILNLTLKGINPHKMERYYNKLLLERQKNLHCKNINKTFDRRKQIENEIAYWSNLGIDQGYELEENGFTKEFIENKIFLLKSELSSYNK